MLRAIEPEVIDVAGATKILQELSINADPLHI